MRMLVTLTFVLTLAALIPVVWVSAQTDGAMLSSSVFDWNDLVARSTGVGERRDVNDSPTATLTRLECHITTLNAGLDSHPQHQHAQEEFIVLKEGELDVIINGSASRVGPGSLFFFAANDWHSVSNVGDVPATYLVFNYQTKRTLSAPPTPAAESAAPEMLASSVYEWSSLESKPTKAGSMRPLFDSPTVTAKNLECHATTLKPGVESHAPHRHADEELIIVMEGEVEATINGESWTVGPGSIFFFASNDLHGLRNAGRTEATYYVVRMVTDETPEA